MATQNRDLSTLRRSFNAQAEVMSNRILPVYTSPVNKTSYIKKIIITNNTSLSGTYDISTHDTTIPYSGNVFVSAIYQSTTAATSTDGITWTTRTLPSASSWQSVAYGNGVYCMVAYATASAARSTDGITWTATTMPSNVAWYAIAYGNGIFLAASNNSTTGAYSTDGITWTTTTVPTSTSNYRMVYGNGIFVLTQQTNATASYTTDGITWTTTNIINSSNNNYLTYGNNLFITTPAGVGPAVSADGANWYPGAMANTSPTVSNWAVSAFGNGTFIAANSNGTYAASSTDGLIWTIRSLPSGGTAYQNAAYGNGRFVINQYGSALSAKAYSTDGITWTAGSMPSVGNWNFLYYPQRNDFLNESYLYKSVTLAANTTQSISYEIMLYPGQEIRVRSTVPMQVTVIGEV